MLCQFSHQLALDYDGNFYWQISRLTCKLTVDFVCKENLTELFYLYAGIFGSLFILEFVTLFRQNFGFSLAAVRDFCSFPTETNITE